MTDPQALMAQALSAYQAGDDARAAETCQRVLKLLPKRHDLWNLLGVVERRQGHLVEAAGHFLQAISLKPEFADAHYNLGNCRKQQQDYQGAVGAYRRALRLRGGWSAPWSELSDALRLAGESAEALVAAQRAVALDPASAEAMNHLGNALVAGSRLEEAQASYETALELSPARAEFACNLAVLLQRQGRFKEALPLAQRALESAPGHLLSRYTLGIILQQLGELGPAEAAYREVSAQEPRHLGAAFNLAGLYNTQGRLDDAQRWYEQCVDIEPEHLAARTELIHLGLRRCDWACLPAAQAVLERACERVPETVRPSPFAFLSLPGATQTQLRHIAAGWAQALCAGVEPLPARGAVALTRPLRIGYVSADFHNHATAHLMLGLFARHDRTRVSVHAYSLGPDDGSDYRRRIRADCDSFSAVGALSDAAIAQQIQADEIDILVDLKGYTRDGRPRIFAFRPAPVQVQYLGYPGTMGASFIDHLITDAVVTPPDRAPYYAERLAFLPHSYQVNDSEQAIADVLPDRAQCGLPAQGFVFGCFCTHYKIEPTIFSLWMDLLQARAGSVLWLIAGNPLAEANLRREAANRGVDPARLVFAAVLPKALHLSRLRHTDLFLDTHFYNGHTTASDALWAGVPVLSCPGEAFASRVGESLLRAIGLPELVAPTLAHYRALALELAADPLRLRALRDRLQANRLTEPLFDTTRFARDLEDLYERIWNEAAASRGR